MALYAEIVGIVAPSEAVAGSRVDIQVKIKNRSASPIGIMASGALEYGVTPYPGVEFPANWANVDPGAVQTFYGSFTMPSSGVKIHAYSYYYTAEGWYFDDEMTKVIDLATLTPQVSEFKIADFNKV